MYIKIFISVEYYIFPASGDSWIQYARTCFRTIWVHKTRVHDTGGRILYPDWQSLTYSWISHHMDIGTSLGGHHNWVQFQIWGHFWIPRPKLHGACYLIFFRKTSKWPRLTSFCFSPQKNAFQGFFNLSFEPCLSSTRCESDTRDELTRTRVTSVNLHSNLNTFIEKFGARTKLSLVYASTLSSSSRGSALLP